MQLRGIVFENLVCLVQILLGFDELVLKANWLVKIDLLAIIHVSERLENTFDLLFFEFVLSPELPNELDDFISSLSVLDDVSLEILNESSQFLLDTVVFSYGPFVVLKVALFFNQIFFELAQIFLESLPLGFDMRDFGLFLSLDFFVKGIDHLFLVVDFFDQLFSLIT